MGVRFLKIGRQGARLYARRNRLQEQLEGRETGVEQRLGDLTTLAEGAYGDAEMGMEERFGDSLTRVEDQVGSDRASARRGITRAMMAGGGDITGQGAATLGEITATGNRTLSDATRNYTDAAVNERRADLNRGDRLSLHGMGVEHDLLNMTLGQFLQNEQMDTMRRTANKQLVADIIGSIASAAGKSKWVTGTPTG